ncbi:MAG TPA: hypothetical protein VGH89_38145 [Pseudonocardia sp.]|jgi:hypothetical protein
MHILHTALELVHQLAGSALPPDPAPEAPPGNVAGSIDKVLSYIKWGAGRALIACFFTGLISFTGGRMWDHHRAGRLGTTMILVSLFGALLYGTGHTLLSSFAGK